MTAPIKKLQNISVMRSKTFGTQFQLFIIGYLTNLRYDKKEESAATIDLALIL